MGGRNNIRTLRRVCGIEGCSASVTAEGPIPHTWDVHEVPNDDHWKAFLRASTRTVLTCSAKCRAKAGLRERKGVIHGRS